MPIDAQNLVVPLWGALSAGAAFIVALVGVVVWAFSYFSTKSDYAEHEERIRIVEQNWGDIKADVSYIRGRLEPK